MAQEIVKKHQAKIVIDLLDPKHYAIAKSYHVTNTIISNEYISKMMTQLRKNRFLFPLYQDLLTYDGEGAEKSYEIYAYQTKDVFNYKFPLSFHAKSDLILSIYKSSNNQFKVIGIVKDGITQIFKGNLNQKDEIILNETDSIFMICK